MIFHPDSEVLPDSNHGVLKLRTKPPKLAFEIGSFRLDMTKPIYVSVEYDIKHRRNGNVTSFGPVHLFNNETEATPTMTSPQTQPQTAMSTTELPTSSTELTAPSARSQPNTLIIVILVLVGLVVVLTVTGIIVYRRRLLTENANKSSDPDQLAYNPNITTNSTTLTTEPGSNSVAVNSMNQYPETIPFISVDNSKAK